MTKVTYTGLLGDFNYLNEQYGQGPFGLVDPTDTAATFIDGLDGGHITFTGKNLSFDDTMPTGGKVTSVSFQNNEGDDFVVVDDGNFKLTQLVDILTDKGVSALVRKLLDGNDTVKGSDAAEPLYGYAGNDTLIGGNGFDLIDGGKGNDKMTGGDGKDYFEFARGYDKDVITDFQAKGSDENRDFLSMSERLQFDVHTIKGGIVVDFGKGDELTLLGVHERDFSKADITIHGDM